MDNDICQLSVDKVKMDFMVSRVKFGSTKKWNPNI